MNHIFTGNGKPNQLYLLASCQRLDAVKMKNRRRPITTEIESRSFVQRT